MIKEGSKVICRGKTYTVFSTKECTSMYPYIEVIDEKGKHWIELLDRFEERVDAGTISHKPKGSIF